MAKKCPNCGAMMLSAATFWDCEECGEFILKPGYGSTSDKSEKIPAGCVACGNPAYPNCKLSCSIFDD